VDILRRSETNSALKTNGKALVEHVRSVQDEKKRRRREEMVALRKERDLALKKVRELEKRLENFELTRNLTHTDESRRVKMLQDKLRESEEARKAAVKKWERLDEECDDLKICLSLQKHMSQEKSIRTKFETKIEDLKSDLKKSERDIAGLTQELEECIQERNVVIKERNEALARLSHFADENDKLTRYAAHLEAQLNK
jgi:chromosome segregation ATPase